jgi:hypothetical protein
MKAANAVREQGEHRPIHKRGAAVCLPLLVSCKSADCRRGSGSITEVVDEKISAENH